MSRCWRRWRALRRTRQSSSFTHSGIRKRQKRLRRWKRRTRMQGHLVARDLVSLRQSFQGTMILGDSITEGLVSYQFLDTSVVAYARGKGVAKNDELIQTALDNKPGKVFMAFGMNDLGYYNGDADHFTEEEYKNDIETLKNGIPGVEIYVNSILPTAESAAAKSPYFAEYAKFNEALEALCQGRGSYIY